MTLSRDLPVNRLKQALATPGPRLLGCWLGLTSPYAAEIAGHSGFDWLLLDGEHAPNDLPSLTAQLQVLDPLPPSAIVRPPVGADWLIKQILDAGAQSLMIPMVHSAAEAEAMVRAVRYPPRGVRGVGFPLARASRFGRVPDYMDTAEDQICLIVQIESRAALDAIEDIAAVEGVDALFIGPADLGADLGLSPEDTVPVVAEAIARITATGKPAATIAVDDHQIQAYVDAGARMIAVGIDVLVLSRGLDALATRWR